MALGSKQPPQIRVPGIFPWGQTWSVRKTDNLTNSMCQISGNLGASTSWNPLRSAKDQYGDCCTFTFVTNCGYATMRKSNITLCQ